MCFVPRQAGAGAGRTGAEGADLCIAEGELHGTGYFPLPVREHAGLCARFTSTGTIRGRHVLPAAAERLSGWYGPADRHDGQHQRSAAALSRGCASARGACPRRGRLRATGNGICCWCALRTTALHGAGACAAQRAAGAFGPRYLPLPRRLGCERGAGVVSVYPYCTARRGSR